jgi:hypothetical protein
MESGFFGLMEFFVVAAFALGWGVLELYCRRLDRIKQAREDAAKTETDSGTS